MKAILFLNMGGPDSIKAVRPFLFNLFSDREIIKLGPRSLQRPIAWFIAKKRAPKSEANYEKIGGKSPLLEITSAQAAGVQKRLEERGYGSIPCLPAMRYWHPRTYRILRDLNARGIKEVVGLSLYPHYSRATTGSSMKEFKECTRELGMETELIESWPDHEGYIRALAATVNEACDRLVESGRINREALKDEKSDFVLVYSAHSLPQSFIDEGDPYVDHINRTVSALEKLTGIRGRLCFQSRSGPVKWLEPGTDTLINELIEKEGKKTLLVLPISFVSDHIETLYEIDMLYGEMARAKGAELFRTPSLNDRPDFLDALTDICAAHL